MNVATIVFLDRTESNCLIKLREEAKYKLYSIS